MSTADALPRISFGSPAGGASTAGETSPATGFSLLSPVAGGVHTHSQAKTSVGNAAISAAQEAARRSGDVSRASAGAGPGAPHSVDLDRLEAQLEADVAALNAELAMLPPKFLRAPSPAYLSIVGRPEE